MDELQAVEARISRLEGERNLLRRLLNQPEQVPSQYSRPLAESPRSLLFTKTNSTAGATDRIKDLLRRRPGLTRAQLVDELGGQDREQRKVIYNTAHSLSRRKKLLTDAEGRLSLP